MARKPIPRPVLSRSQFELTPEFLACTPGQRAWLLALLDGGFNYTNATLSAFHCGSRRIAQIRSFAVRKSPNVHAAIAVLLGRSEAELVRESQVSQATRLLREVDRNLKAAKPGSTASQQLLVQKERLLGLCAAVPSAAPSAGEPVPNPAPQPQPVRDPRIPKDALKVWLDGNGAVVGYRSALGEDIKL